MELNPYKLIETELSELEIVLRNSIYSDIELATEVSSYIVRSGGKRIRPILSVLVAKTLGYRGKHSHSFSCKNPRLQRKRIDKSGCCYRTASYSHFNP